MAPEVEAVIAQIYADHHAERTAVLPDTTAERIVAQLKETVDRYW